MKTGIKRKARLTEFTIRQYGVNGAIMAALFVFGLYLSASLSTFALLLYVLLWVASFVLIHATTCRHCAYYGKQCPVPLEGSCSHLLFERGSNFGVMAGLGGLLAYVLRVCIPYVAIFHMGSLWIFVLYTGLIAIFFYVLLYHTGCPNCISTKCPMNPDYGAGWPVDGIGHRSKVHE